jgi:hypothetical protein
MTRHLPNDDCRCYGNGCEQRLGCLRCTVIAYDNPTAWISYSGNLNVGGGGQGLRIFHRGQRCSEDLENPRLKSFSSRK